MADKQVEPKKPLSPPLSPITSTFTPSTLSTSSTPLTSVNASLPSTPLSSGSLSIPSSPKVSSPLKNELATPNSCSTSKEQGTSSTSTNIVPGSTTIQTSLPNYATSITKKAFHGDRAAADFLAAFGSSTPIVKAVYDVGSYIDTLARTRKDFIKAQAEMDKRVQAMGRTLPHGPYSANIIRNLEEIDPLHSYKATYFSTSSPDRSQSTSTLPISTSKETLQKSLVQSTKSSDVDKQSIHDGSSSHSRDDNKTPILLGRNNKWTRCGRPSCKFCSGLDNRRTLCAGYFCHWCESYAPGHPAKFCAKNPYRGLESWQLPAGTLEMVEYRNGPLPSQYNHPRGRLPQPKLSSTDNTTTVGSGSERHSPAKSHTTTTSLGPTYRPTYSPKRPNISTKSTRGRGNYGRLSTTLHTPSSVTDCCSGKRFHTANCKFAEYLAFSRSSDTASHDENIDSHYEYDDVELYNIVGEGHID